MHHTNIFVQIAIAIVVATSFAVVAKWLRQPLILAYIAAGILVGQTEGFGWVNTADIEPISELGLILLLFMIGLEIDLKQLREAGKPVVAVGVTQFLISVGMGLLLLPLIPVDLGGGTYSTLYLSIAAALSSTMIVVKLLYDKLELDTLPGRLTLGVLVFQDIWAILFLAFQKDLNNPQPVLVAASIAKGLGLVAAALAMTRYVLPPLFQSVAKLPELMLTGALAWCFGVAMFASWLGLSREMGALIAGIAMSAFPYNLDVIAKVISLRDFFITLFFVSLGTKIPRPTPELLLGAAALSVFVIVSRFISITPVLHMMRSGNRLSLVPAMNLSQISEFSLVICSIGLALGHIDERTLSLVVFTLVLTSISSTYMIIYNHQIFSAINPVLRRLGLHDVGDTDAGRDELPSKEIIFLGFSRYASSLLQELLSRDPRMADRIGVVDFNPQVKQELDRRGILCLYGDVSHVDTLRHAKVGEARVLLSTIPDSVLKGTTNARLLRTAKSLSRGARTIVTAEFYYTARELYSEGASFVFVPRLMSIRELADVTLAAVEGNLDEARNLANQEIEIRAEMEVLP